MKRLLNEVRKGNDTDVENELFLDNDDNPLLRNKNYKITDISIIVLLLSHIRLNLSRFSTKFFLQSSI